MKYSLFPNGTSHMIWLDSNCDQCWKSRVNERTGKSRCAIENAIAVASILDGTLLCGERTEEQAAKLARRLNWDGTSYLENDCPERQEKRPRRQRVIRNASDLPLFKVTVQEVAK